ncbi:MAG: S8 family serine peptidase, partial [Lachnospiraceae bacterium]|nr:S8 family serine peptidase [Lachnospiraceae bacterium]
QIKSGTSMSTPLVSGALALLLEKYPMMTNVEVKLRIRERAMDLGLPHNQQGWGMLDVGRLLEG